MSRYPWCGLVLALGLGAVAARAAELPRSLDLDLIRSLPVQHDGRWPPLDTLARDVVETVTGEIFYQGHDPVLLLLAWTFDADHWMQEPLIPIANAALRAELQLASTRTRFSYSELAAHRRLHELVDQVHRAGNRKLDPLESKVRDIEDKLILLQRVFFGQAIRIVPDPHDPLGRWQPVKVQQEAEGPLETAWSALRTAFLADDAEAFREAAGKLLTAQAELPAAHRPDARLIDTELRFNRLHPFRAAWIIMALGALLAAVALFVRRRWCDALAVIVLLAGFGVLTYGLGLRWQIAGRIPAANMYESLLFVSWGAGAFAIVALLVQRHRSVPLTASALGALALALADTLPLDHYIRPIAPVLLDTYWMSIHVPIIMVSYSVLALAVFIAHVQLVLMALLPRRRDLAAALDGLHYWYVHVGSILLLVGIVTGSMWAASSWGRYWGWDPKEVWSLVALLGYMVILHVRIDHERRAPWMYVVAAVLGAATLALVVPRLGPVTGLKLLIFAGVTAVMILFVLARGAFATALKSILAFWLIIMTYVGVNFVLGIGLHSYAFGTGAVVYYMFLVGGIDLGLILLCSLAYLARRPREATGPAPRAA